MAVNDSRQRGAVYAKLLGRLGHGQSKRGDHVVAQGQAGVRGVEHASHVQALSVVVLVIDQFRVGAVELKGQPPVAADRHRGVAVLFWKNSAVGSKNIN